MEVKHGEMIQLRGINNIRAVDEVEQYARSFLKVLNKITYNPQNIISEVA
jgi:hypothetical protein